MPRARARVHARGESVKNAPAADKKANFAERENKKKRASTTMRTLFEAAAAPGKEAEGAEVDFFCFFAFAAAFFPISSFTFFYYVVTRRKKRVSESVSRVPEISSLGEKKVTK
jgi:hypothetical protein